MLSQVFLITQRVTLLFSGTLNAQSRTHNAHVTLFALCTLLRSSSFVPIFTLLTRFFTDILHQNKPHGHFLYPTRLLSKPTLKHPLPCHVIGFTVCTRDANFGGCQCAY